MATKFAIHDPARQSLSRATDTVDCVREWSHPFGPARPQTLSSARADVRQEIERKEIEARAATFMEMSERELQSLAFAEFVQWFREWRAARR